MYLFYAEGSSLVCFQSVSNPAKKVKKSGIEL